MNVRSPLTKGNIRELQAILKGQILRPGDDGYDTGRKVWNGMIDCRPALIARCSDTDDVVAAVNFARDYGLVVAVRGGGHSAAGLGVCDDGMVVDLSLMRKVQVDPVERTARAQGGATWSDVDRATQDFGLATTGGEISTTGIGGLTLDGGHGWLMRHYGLTCDNLRSVEIVTADGRALTASHSEYPDLFWGTRGGGGNFGVATSLEYQLHPVGPVLAGMLLYPITQARDALQFFREFTHNAPDALTTGAGLLATPDGTPVVALLLCYSGSVDEGERVIAPLRSFGSPLAGQIEPTSYVAHQSMLDDGFPPGLQVYWRAEYMERFDDAVIDVLASRFTDSPSPVTAIVIEHMGGAVARVGRGATAYAHRDAPYSVSVISRWIDADEAEQNFRWTRNLSNGVQRFASGVYVNYLGVGEGEDRVRVAYGDEMYSRLVAVKNTYDPTNFFRLNQNIRPSA